MGDATVDTRILQVLDARVDWPEISRRCNELGIDERLLRALAEVESGGRVAGPDGEIVARFEPHLFVPGTYNWRSFLALSASARRQRFFAALGDDPERAIGSTSWGAMQVLGRHHLLLGHETAAAFLSYLCASGTNQYLAGLLFIERSGGRNAARALDWPEIARFYNGPGNVSAYARRLRDAYARVGGRWSLPVLRIGARGDDVRQLQRALNVPEDGLFGRETLGAVLAFQRARGLATDGVVGPLTWAALNDAVVSDGSAVLPEVGTGGDLPRSRLPGLLLTAGGAAITGAVASEAGVDWAALGVGAALIASGLLLQR